MKIVHFFAGALACMGALVMYGLAEVPDAAASAPQRLPSPGLVEAGVQRSVPSELEGEPEPMACCKVCTKGKACGNSCIARDKVCHQPPGCACDG